ncbi:MAG: epoxyqueuosine reductase [Peptococcaceae bacterium]
MRNVIEAGIKDYIRNYQKGAQIRTRWGEPLIGYADAKDSLFADLQKIIRPTHALPTELLPTAKTVITYFIPFDRQIPLSNLRGRESSPEWAVSYIETNDLIVNLNKFLHELLLEANYQSAVLPPTHNFDEEELLSDWSHKHAAYISGLGKFGLHQMLITEKGTCGRLGSVVTECRITATPRSSEEFCLYKYNKTCKKCLEKCVTGALSETSFARHLCYDFLLQMADKYAHEGMADVCGKCVSVVPCSFTRPVRE